MREVIVKLNSDRIKVKGGEYVQDLVRCKECKYCDYVDMKTHLWCDNQEHYVLADDYCSYGEVRDE